MKLILVGAGPGDPDLITLKGIKALRAARVVLYDALVAPELLDYCPDDCVKINVGKRYQQQSCQQDVINLMIVEQVSKFGEVVRLKGGDPFIFGRGFEEAEYAARFGITTEIIPGISSSYAVPAMAGVPLTVRGLSESFWVITGTTKHHELSSDIQWAARSTATVVILMGMNKLPEIVETFRDAGKNDVGIVIIQNGTLPNEKIVQGKIGDILQKATAAAIGSPAVMVIGKVAGLSRDYLSRIAQESQKKDADDLSVSCQATSQNKC